MYTGCYDKIYFFFNTCAIELFLYTTVKNKRSTQKQICHMLGCFKSILNYTKTCIVIAYSFKWAPCMQVVLLIHKLISIMMLFWIWYLIVSFLLQTTSSIIVLMYDNLWSKNSNDNDVVSCDSTKFDTFSRLISYEYWQ